MRGYQGKILLKKNFVSSPSFCAESLKINCTSKMHNENLCGKEYEEANVGSRTTKYFTL